MKGNTVRQRSGGTPEKHSRWGRKALPIALLLAVSLCLLLAFTAEYIRHQAEPILRTRILETLSARFGVPVQLDRLDVSLRSGIEVQGWGLRIPFAPTMPGSAPSGTLLRVQHFSFRTTVRALFRQPTHVEQVKISGMELRMPPPAARDALLGRRASSTTGPGPRIALVVSELECSDVKFLIDSGKPGKDPLEFDISELLLHDVAPGHALLYDAQLINPRPRGALHVAGHFGPWGGIPTVGAAAVEPGKTPLDGTYTLEHADLKSMRGIGGTLGSAGTFRGDLERIAVDGTTEVPNFSLDLSNHSVPLHTRFHATVDVTSGDTYLQAVQARLLQSTFTVVGKVVRLKGRGHDTELDINVPHGRVQDFLQLAMKTAPPLMNGSLALQAHLHIASGPERLPVRMSMAGRFGITGVRFNNARWQGQIDGLSARAQGRPQQVVVITKSHDTEAHSAMGAQFTLNGGILRVADLRYEVPGAHLQMNGVYSMDGQLFEFKGHVHTEATASQMVTGWKSWLLQPVDRFLRNAGSGVNLPVQVSGTEGEVHLGLALEGADAAPAQILTEMRSEQAAKHEMDAARREAALADAEDRRAARVTTLDEAEQAHRAAVQHRAAAQSYLDAAKRSSNTQP